MASKARRFLPDYPNWHPESIGDCIEVEIDYTKPHRNWYYCPNCKLTWVQDVGGSLERSDKPILGTCPSTMWRNGCKNSGFPYYSGTGALIPPIKTVQKGNKMAKLSIPVTWSVHASAIVDENNAEVSLLLYIKGADIIEVLDKAAALIEKMQVHAYQFFEVSVNKYEEEENNEDE